MAVGLAQAAFEKAKPLPELPVADSPGAALAAALAPAACEEAAPSRKLQLGASTSKIFGALACNYEPSAGWSETPKCNKDCRRHGLEFRGAENRDALLLVFWRLKCPDVLGRQTALIVYHFGAIFGPRGPA